MPLSEAISNTHVALTKKGNNGTTFCMGDYVCAPENSFRFFFCSFSSSQEKSLNDSVHRWCYRCLVFLSAFQFNVKSKDLFLFELLLSSTRNSRIKFEYNRKVIVSWSSIFLSFFTERRRHCLSYCRRQWREWNRFHLNRKIIIKKKVNQQAMK